MVYTYVQKKKTESRNYNITRYSILYCIYTDICYYYFTCTIVFKHHRINDNSFEMGIRRNKNKTKKQKHKNSNEIKKKKKHTSSNEIKKNGERIVGDANNA